ncbi:MAG: hypothetical protein FWD31_01650 [Planctomycetaceae bacterium]|nr:hypothetical protein [Planctomycetaceae bacterium]
MKSASGLRVDESKLKEISLLDGCYCLTTSVGAGEMDKESVHARYKDLAMVEEAFRTCKTGHLELRPIYVRKAERTRAHVFVVMLSYLLVRELRECWRDTDATVEENLTALSGLCGIRVSAPSGEEVYLIPKPRPELNKLFDLANTTPPAILPAGKTNADTERKLKSRRK